MDIINEPFILTEYGQGYRKVFDKELAVTDFNTEIWKQLIYHKNKWMSKSLKTIIDYIIEYEFSN